MAWTGRWLVVGLVLAIGCKGDEDKSEAGPVDADGDGFTEDEDCDDNDATVYPGAAEDCDGKDNDCDGLTDIDDPDVINVESGNVDSDLDGYGDALLISNYCPGMRPDNVVDNADDCDDRDDAIHPDGNEVCDGEDNDCDGLVDGEDTDADAIPTWAPDGDGDGYGDADASFKSCDDPGEGFAENARDCDDSTSSVNPDASEVCGDGVDSDCDGADGPDRFEGDGALSCGYVGWDFAATELASGDLDGDGATELALADPDEGVAIVSDPLDAGLAVVSGAPSGADFGAAVAVGDADGDGAAELFVGEADGDGAVVVFGGPSSGGLAYSAGTRQAGPSSADGYGAALLFVEDQGGDGAPDLFVGAPASAGGDGGLWVWTDAGDGGSSMEVELGVSVGVHAELGASLADLGDIDGDGLSDVAVGAPGRNTVVVVLGGLSGGAASSTVVLEDMEDGSDFGRSVGGGVDLDDDGLDDLIVGAPEDGTSGGSVYIFVAPSGTVAAADAYARIDGPGAGAQLGFSSAGVGDIDHDGFMDIALGAPGWSSDTGRLEVVMGPVPAGVPATSNDVAYHLSGDSAGDAAGAAALAPRDVNGDGHPDFVGSAPGANRTWIFLGAALFAEE